MNDSSAGLERRIGQRFPYLLPVSFRETGAGIDGVGFTQDVSSRGVFFLTDAALREGSEIELTLKMPSEITLGEDMRVRARGRVLRVFGPAVSRKDSPGSVHIETVRIETKIGVAVRFDHYEYLPELSEPIASVSRAAALHPHRETEEGTAQMARPPIPGLI
jgi:hypothetical protein